MLGFWGGGYLGVYYRVLGVGGHWGGHWGEILGIFSSDFVPLEPSYGYELTTEHVIEQELLLIQYSFSLLYALNWLQISCRWSSKDACGRTRRGRQRPSWMSRIQRQQADSGDRRSTTKSQKSYSYQEHWGERFRWSTGPKSTKHSAVFALGSPFLERNGGQRIHAKPSHPRLWFMENCTRKGKGRPARQVWNAQRVLW